ncbi:MAG: peptidyl-prolyl cis-trans isomerase [Acidobacteriota bacterium]
MLKFFNRLEKTRNFVLLVFAILMVGSLVLFYAPTQGGLESNLGRSKETVASVSGQTISLGDVVRQQENYSRYSQGRPFPANLVLDSLIGSRIARVEAERLGLTASDKEVADAIREQMKKPDGTSIDQATYEQNAIEQSGSIGEYEQGIRDDLSAKKLEAFITAGVTVSDDEVLSDFQKKNTKFDLSYVSIDPAELSKTIVPTDADLRDYFEKNKKSYYIASPQKKIKYIFVNTNKIGEKLPISDADLKAEYDKLPADKKIGGVLGQEIVLRVAKPDLDGVVQAKAAQLIQRLKGDGSQPVTEQAFADMAKGQSEDPASASSGGKLRGPVKENLNKPDDPYQRLLKMKPGEISEPISYQSRYFILRRGEDVPKSFEDAKKEIEVSLRNRRAYSVAADLAQRIDDTLKQNKDIQKTAQQFAAEANSTPAEMIKETPYIKPSDDVPNIGTSPQFEDGIRPLETVGDVGEKTPIQNGFAIPMLADRKEPRDAEFDEVKAQITDVVKLEKARAQVEQIANAIASGSPNAAALVAAAAAKGLKAKEQKNFILGSPLGEGPTATTNPEIEDAIYAMKVGDVTKTPLRMGENWVVVGVTKREEASTADFAKTRSTLIEQMLAKKRNAVFSDYLAATKKKLEESGNIKIYKDVLAKVNTAATGGAPAPEDGQ